jgi:hypothetical protein
MTFIGRRRQRDSRQPVPTSGDKAISSLIEAGSAMSGAAAGAALSIIGGEFALTAGAAVGAGMGVALRQAAEELRSRVLAPRETARIGTALSFAVIAIEDRRSEGQQLRNDDFFDPPSDLSDRSPAEEVVEGILLAAQKEHEERKLHLHGELLAGIAYKYCTRGQANFLIRTFESLTYRQICMLVLFNRFFGRWVRI